MGEKDNARAGASLVKIVGKELSRPANENRESMGVFARGGVCVRDYCVIGRRDDGGFRGGRKIEWRPD